MNFMLKTNESSVAILEIYNYLTTKLNPNIECNNFQMTIQVKLGKIFEIYLSIAKPIDAGEYFETMLIKDTNPFYNEEWGYSDVLRFETHEEVYDEIIRIMECVTNKEINDYIIATGNDQDFVETGFVKKTAKETFHYIVLADGHGKNNVIDKIKALKWPKILCNFEKDNIFKHLELNDNNTPKSGSTLSIVKIYSDRIECFWVGDSTIKIFKNNEEFFVSKSHNQDNVEEFERIKKSDFYIGFTKAHKHEVIDENNITMIEDGGRYFQFERNNIIEKINMTNSLGHNNVTGKFIQNKTILINNDDKYEVIVGSDGLWDMVISKDKINDMNSESLCKMAYGRWTQVWTYQEQQCKFPDIDDIAVATFSNSIIR